jgi:guanine deaminase
MKSSALIGSIIHAIRLGEVKILEYGAIIYNQLGTIENVIELTSPEDKTNILNTYDCIDYTGKLIIPGFVDAHCHAPQYFFSGNGIDIPLLEWLQKYTFPVESKFSNTDFASHVYRKSVSRHLLSGTTFASYYGTIHKEATKVLVDTVMELGQRAYVGKVSMDRNSPDSLIESTEQGLKDNEEFVRYTLAKTEIGTQ